MWIQRGDISLWNELADLCMMWLWLLFDKNYIELSYHKYGIVGSGKTLREVYQWRYTLEIEQMAMLFYLNDKIK